MLSTILLYNIIIKGQKRGRNMFGLNKAFNKSNSKKEHSAASEKYSDNHMPITKSCFVDTTSIWNGGNKTRYRASDEAQSRLLRFFDGKPNKAESDSVVEKIY